MGKLHSQEFTGCMGMGIVTWESDLNWIYVNDKTLGPTLDSSRLQGPVGSSLLWSVAQIKVL